MPEQLAPTYTWPRRSALVALLAAFIALALLTASGFGYRWQWWPLGTAFAMLRWGAWLGAAAMLLGLIAGGLSLRRKSGQFTALALIALIGGGVALAMPGQWLLKARDLPRIHDITTDPADPPAFVAIVPLRQSAPNPVGYDYAVNAEAQRQAYPDIQTMRLPVPSDQVFAAANLAVQQLGWQLVAADAEDGRIEATDTTRWFGFKDDVVVRIRAADDQTLVDVRSKSRVGKSDVGVNADRIRTFRKKLEKNLRLP
ncbi:MAG: DUF1499 domain-containing protein [Gammaproteobacteria bacterium]|nr:DUF1499 domain-containing protein [Gammaproteobacteria bacterium]